MGRMRSRRGANAIEFALIAPVLIALATGSIDFAFALGLRYAAASAADHGARIGATTSQEGSPESVATSEALSKWTSFGLPHTPTIVSFREGSPELVVVRIDVDFEPLVGIMPGISGFEVTRVRRMEQQP